MLQYKPETTAECAYRAGINYSLSSATEEMTKILEDLSGRPVTDEELRRFNSFCKDLRQKGTENKELFGKAERASLLIDINQIMSEVFGIKLSGEHFYVVDAFLTGLIRSYIRYPFYIGYVNRFPCKACKTELQTNCFAS